MSQSSFESPAESSIPSVVVVESSTSVTGTTSSNGQSASPRDLAGTGDPQQPNPTPDTGGVDVFQQYPLIQQWITSSSAMFANLNTDRGVRVSVEDVNTLRKLFDLKDGMRHWKKEMSKVITEGSAERKAALL